MKYQALILDAGGVMVKAVHGAWNIPAEYARILGADAASVGTAQWQAAHDRNAHIIREDVLMPDDLSREYALRREFLCAMARDLNWQATPEQLSRLAKDFTENPARYIWYADVNAYLAKWQGEIKLGMLSDAMPSFRPFTVAHRSDIYFSEILLSTDVGCTKPDATMYLTLCRRMNVAPERCLFVDDREINLIGAEKLGMRAVQMDREGDVRRWQGEVVHNFEELDAFFHADAPDTEEQA